MRHPIRRHAFDTVTLPSDEMRRAMASAEVGDDVYGEDPTINRLEARAAEIFAHSLRRRLSDNGEVGVF